MVAQGRVHPDIVSTLASRLARLNREISQDDAREIASVSGGKTLSSMTADLLTSIDTDLTEQKAIEKFEIPENQEPSIKQLDEIERENMTEALKPFHQPKLRELIIAIKSSLEQIIDEITQDELLSAGFDAAAKLKAQSLLADFRKFLEDNREEIEAIQILYSQPYRAGLRYSQLKELRNAIERPPLSLKRPEFRLWRLYEAVEPMSVKGKGGNALVDLVAIVRHALHPETPIIPVAEVVEERYKQWLAEQRDAGVVFTVDQRRWLDAIKDHIASSLRIEQDDFDDIPFSQLGGLGKAYQLFGDKLPIILEELNERLAA
jgi:type I restriction enzyme R subunit